MERPYGALIDAYATIIRFNNYRIQGFERLVGNRTDYRCTSGWQDVESRSGIVHFSPFTRAARESGYVDQFESRSRSKIICANVDIHDLAGEINNPSTGLALALLLNHLGIEADYFGFNGFKTPHYWTNNVHGTTHSATEFGVLCSLSKSYVIGSTYPYQLLYDFCHTNHTEYNENVGLHLVHYLKRSFTNKKILEFGAGNGDLARALERSGNRVTAFEVSQAAFVKIQCSRKIQDNAIGLFVEKQKHDLFVSVDVLEHLTECDIRLVIREAARLCSGIFLSVSTRPSGLLGPNGENLHLTVKPSAWWLELVSEYFDVSLSHGYGTGQIVLEGSLRKRSHLRYDHTSIHLENHGLPTGYVSRPKPVYYVDSPEHRSGLIWQPDVYPVAANIARDLGAGTLIDIGCGRAEKLMALAGQFRIIGVDYGPNLDWCRREHPATSWVHVDLEHPDLWPLPDERVRDSVIICSDVIEHLMDPSALLANLQSLSRQAKAVVISTPERDLTHGVSHSGPPPNPAHTREWALDEFVVLLEHHGFTVQWAGITRSNNADEARKTLMVVAGDGPDRLLKDWRRPHTHPTGNRTPIETLWSNQIDGWVADTSKAGQPQPAPVQDLATAPKPPISQFSKLTEAESLARQALALDPRGPDALALLAHVLFKQQRWLDCARTCQELLSVQRRNTDGMVILAECLVNLGDLPTALEVFRNALAIAPDDGELAARIDQIEKRCAPSVTLTPAQEAAIEEGLQALERNEIQTAFEHYRRAQGLGPAHPDLDVIVRELEIRLNTAPVRQADPGDASDAGRVPSRASGQQDASQSASNPSQTNAGSPTPTPGHTPLISVVLPTYNRPELLERCLRGFSAQSLAANLFEVVIVDDGSEPPVRSVADSFGDKLRIRYHYQSNSGLAAARNQAIALASAPWLALHDDDDVPDPEYLQGCVDFHRKHPAETDILLARVLPSPSLPVTPMLEWTFDAGNGVIGFPEPGVWHGFTRFYGGTSSCKRALFRHGQYDPEYRFGYEDMELAFRLNRRIPLRVQYHPEVFSHLVRSPDFPGTFRRLYREGRSLRRFFEQQGDSAFSIIPPEFRHCSEWVAQLEPRIPELMGIIRRLEIPDGTLPISITVDGRKLSGSEALKAAYSICARFARGRGWLDFGVGLEETQGLERIKKTLDTYLTSGSEGAPLTRTTIVHEESRTKHALAYFHSNLFPPRSGAHRRCLSLLVALRSLGYEVTLVSSDLFTDQPWSEESMIGLARTFGIRTRIHRATGSDREFVARRQQAGDFWNMHTPPDLVAFFRKAARETVPDLVLVNYAYCSGLAEIPELDGCLRVLEMHDLVSLSASMAGAAWRRLGQGPYGQGSVSADFLDERFNQRLGLSVDPEEFRRYSGFDLVTAISNIETASIRSNAPDSNPVWLPMAHDSVAIDNRYDGPPVFVIFTNPFNIQGHLYFLERVLPRVQAVIPDFRLRVVGDACRVLKSVPGVELLGFVPDLKTIYADAGYAICPLIGGTGMQVKIVEAMAHGVPVIALRNVAGSSPIEHGVNGYIVDTAEQFADHLIRLHQDRELCRSLGHAARQRIEAEFSSEDLAHRLESALASRTARRPIRSAPASSETTPRPAECLGLPVRWAAPFFNPSGYASEAINFVLPLEGRFTLGIHHNSSIYSEVFVRGLAAEDRESLFRMRDRFGSLQGGIVISHGPAGFFTRPADADYLVGRTMFETDRIAPDWVAACNRMNEVWVPSRFNLETFAASGVERSKLVLMPEAVDARFFDPARHTAYPLPGRARFNFLSIFEWSSRKGWDVLIAAYLREFSAQDDVCLWLRTYLVSKPDGDPTEEIRRRISDFTATLGLEGKELPRIELIAQQVPSDELPGLYLACDCYVAPSRGEGWGRPQHEAMLMERPVIATNWSANTEFMSAENSYLLDYELVEARGLEPELWHYKGHRWANPSESHLRTLMRRVFDQPEEAKAKGRTARAHMDRHYSREAVTEQVVRRLQAIERSLISPQLPAVTATDIHGLTAADTAGPSGHTTAQTALTLAFEGSFLDLGSLSHVNRSLVQHLQQEPGVRAVAVSHGESAAGAVPQELKGWAQKVQRRSPANTRVTVRHHWPPDWKRPERGAWVLIQPWEYGSVPAEWAEKAQGVDEIWCPSRYVRGLYLQAGIPAEKLRVLPNGYNAAVHHPGAAPTPIASGKRFKFLFVGGTIPRKGADLLLDTYLKTFRHFDDVCLVIKDFGGRSAYQGQTLHERIQAAQRDPSGPEIVYIDQDLTEREVAGLYTACDCLVHPYRGEGFGLPVLEAMACALPVICTGGGSTDDFATDEFVHRIPATREFIGTEVGGMRLDHRGWWMSPDPQALRQAMLEAVGQSPRWRERARRGAEHVAAHLTWEHAAQTAARLARALAARIDTRTGQAKPAAGKAITLPEAALLGDLMAAKKALQAGDAAEAWRLGSLAIGERPFHPEGWVFLSEVAAGVGQRALARRCARKAVALTPNWKPAKRQLSGIPGGPDKPTVDLPEPPFREGQPPRLTVCLIAKNEERFIDGCLSSIRGLADQIVLVDTGSTDRTVEIARSHGAEVHFRAWDNDFSAARNAALMHARGDWILILDADEEVSREHHDALRALLLQANAIAYRLPLVDVGREGEGVSQVPRLFRNAPRQFYVSRIHEQVYASLEINRENWSMENRFGDAQLVHHGYQAEVVQSRDKVQRNLRLLELANEEHPNDVNLLMNLGLELWRSGQRSHGIGYYRQSYEAMLRRPFAETPPELREVLLTQYASHLMTLHRHEEVVGLFHDRAILPKDRTASHHFMLGLAHSALKQWEPCASHLKQCLELRGKPALTPIHPDIRSGTPAHCMAHALRKLGRKTEAGVGYEQALRDDPANEAARVELALFLAEEGRVVPALTVLNEGIQADPAQAKVWEAGAGLSLRQSETLEFALDWTREALRHLPDHATLRRQRAEALLLAGQVQEALPLWIGQGPGSEATTASGLILCRLFAGEPLTAVPPDRERAVSQDVLRRYRQAVELGLEDWVRTLHRRLAELRVALPSAAGLIEQVVAESGLDH